MKCLHIITPVKDSIDSTLETIKAIYESEITVPFTYTIYNDFSREDTTKKLERASKEYGFEFVNLSDITSTPSPNYLLVLQIAQEKAIKACAGLLIIESDVIVEKETIESLFNQTLARKDCGIAASVTVDDSGEINYPYLYAKGRQKEVYNESKHLSFCCSLLSLELLKSYSFKQLNPEKNWYDVTISRQSIAEGFCNYLFVNLPVIHRPHASRPWKQLKYKNPLKYYWLKYTKGLDKI
ncbi:MAG: glycosyltransferase family 2 protein [Rikenellaceae bacterium]